MDYIDRNLQESPHAIHRQDSTDDGIGEGIDEVAEDDQMDDELGAPLEASSEGNADEDEDSECCFHVGETGESYDELGFEADDEWEVERLKALSCIYIIYSHANDGFHIVFWVAWYYSIIWLEDICQC